MCHNRRREGGGVYTGSSSIMGVLKNFGPILKSQKHLRWVSKCRFLVILPPAAILLQIVMVSPGTHLVKSYESQSRTNEAKLKK